MSQSRRLLSSLVSALCLVSLASFAALSTIGCTGGDDDSMMDAGMDAGSDASMPLAPITVKVLGTSENPMPVANAQVSVNAADGSLLGSGLTDSSGSLQITADLISPATLDSVASISVGALDTRIESTAMLQSTYGVQPGGTYNFYFRQPADAAATEIVGTLNVTLSNMPSGASLYNVFMGNGCGSVLELNGPIATLPLTIARRCLQQDGTFSMYVMAVNNTNTALGYASVEDFEINSGANTLTLGSWTQYPGQPLSFINAPSTLVTSAGQYTTSAGLSFYRKGQLYSPATADTVPAEGVVSGTSYSKTYEVPTGFAWPTPGMGNAVIFSGAFSTPQGDFFGGFMTQTAALPTNGQYDTSTKLPSTFAISATQNSGSTATPVIDTTIPSGVFDGIFALSIWEDTPGLAWVIKAPAANDNLVFPTLPPAMSVIYSPATGAQFLESLVFAFDMSWITNTQTYLQSEDAFSVALTETLDAPASDTDPLVKYAATIPSASAFRSRQPELSKRIKELMPLFAR